MLLYTPPPLDAVGLKILRELRCIAPYGWKYLGLVTSLEAAMKILGTASWTAALRPRDLRGYIEVRHPTEPIPLLRGVGREARRLDKDAVEFRLTESGHDVLDRSMLIQLTPNA